MISLANQNNLNYVVPINEIPGCISDPFLNSWLYENYNLVGHDNQSQMHSFKQGYNHQTAGQFDKVQSDELIMDNLYGHNGLASVDIFHENNVPLPYIPERLLESLSKSIFSAKSSAIPLKPKSAITKKINSHSKKEHQV